MSLRTLPEARQFQRPQNFRCDVPSDVLARWAEHPLAAADDEDATISMFDLIGEDFWSGGGVTAKRVSAALRSIGKRDVTVKINSPGGDLFEGIAIYNLLRQHPAKVTVQVMGWAASAASIIAMAGDEIVMGLGTFMMVHNAWGMVIGNRHDFGEAAGMFAGFDSAIVDIYEARSSAGRAAIEKLMDAETFMGPTDAVVYGFADRVDEGLSAGDAEASAKDRGLMARRQIEAALARAGFSRDVRSEMISEVMSSAATRDAGRSATRDAGDIRTGLRALIATLKS